MMRPPRKDDDETDGPVELRPLKLSSLSGAPAHRKKTRKTSQEKPARQKAASTPEMEVSSVRDTTPPAPARTRKGAAPGRSASTSQSSSATSGKKRSGPRGGRALTESRIRNIAEHYVSQRECSRQMLVDMLGRRLFKRVSGLDAETAHKERAEAEPLIEAEADRLVKAGLIDDARFAEMKARSWLASGRGARRIVMDLSQKGISRADAELAIAAAARETTGILDPEVDSDEVCVSAEWEAADALARKKRIGKYRRQPMPEDYPSRAKVWRREAAAMARAGFEIDLIRQILDQEPEPDETF